MYEYPDVNGDVVPRDYVEAARLFRESAEQGNAEAQIRLGEMYAWDWSGAERWPFAEDHAEAVRW
jgi:TPR repeat protein